MAGGLSYGIAKATLSLAVDNGIAPTDTRVLPRTNEAIAMLLSEGTWVGGLQTVDIVATGTDGDELLLPKEMENAMEVEVLNGATVRAQIDVTQGWSMVNQFAYVDPAAAKDNPLVDLFLEPDADPTILRRRYRYPGLQAGATVRVTGAKRYVPITADGDYLIIQNLRAIKLAILAIEREENNAHEESEAFRQKALGLLQSEVKKHQLDPNNSLRRKAEYEADLVTYQEGTFGHTRARLALTLQGGLMMGKGELTRLLEQSEMRLIDKGQWVGTLEEFKAEVQNGYTLFPNRVKAIIAANFDGSPLDIRSILFQYQENGPGFACGGVAHTLIDQGEVYFPETGKMRRKYKLTGTPSTDEGDIELEETLTLYYRIKNTGEFQLWNNDQLKWFSLGTAGALGHEVLTLTTPGEA